MSVDPEERATAGSRWLVKTASTPADVESLRREVGQLRRAAHPGVVEIGRWHDGDGTAELWTRYAGTPLSQLGRLPAAEIAGLGAAVATLLADLHDLTIVHARVDDDRILVGPDGRPVLCAFGGATSLAETDPSVDVDGLVAALRAHLGPGAPRRLQRLLRTGRRRAMPARSLATSLSASVPDRRLPHPAGGHAEPTGALGAAGIGTDRPVQDAEPLVAGPGDTGPVIEEVAAAHRHRRTDGVHGDRRRPRSRPPHLTRRVTLTIVVVAAVGVAVLAGAAVRGARTPSTAAVACPAVDAGCGPLPVRDGRFVTSSGSWAVGIADPVVVVLGRWACTSPSLPAALNRRTGQVWAWSAWAGPIGTVTASPVATRPGASTLRVVPGRSGCDRIAVVGPGRLVDVVAPGRSRG